MKTKFDQLDQKLDQVIDVNNQQNIHLEKLSGIAEQNRVVLDSHMKRTEINEARIILVENSLTTHLGFIKGAVWILGSIGTLIGLTIAVLNYTKH